MGRSKALLPFGDETLLGRVVRIVSAVAAPVVIVGARGQEFAGLPAGVLTAEDAVSDRGPLAGIAAGLAALEGQADVAFIAGCDAPFLRTEFITGLLSMLAEHDAVVPRIEGRWHPLAAIYALSVRAAAEARLAAGQFKLQDFVAAIDARPVDEEALRAIDPTLGSLQNVNAPEEYQAALRSAGFSAESDGDVRQAPSS